MSSVVVLPAPFGPSRATTSPSDDVERHVAHDRELSVAGDEVSNGEQLAHRVTAGGLDADGVLSEVRAEHVGVRRGSLPACPMR